VPAGSGYFSGEAIGRPGSMRARPGVELIASERNPS
jgi:hypothetical protein